MTPYEMLENVRSLILNAECSPLPSEGDQAALLYFLRQAREVLRAEVDVSSVEAV